MGSLEHTEVRTMYEKGGEKAAVSRRWVASGLAETGMERAGVEVVKVPIKVATTSESWRRRVRPEADERLRAHCIIINVKGS